MLWVGHRLSGSEKGVTDTERKGWSRTSANGLESERSADIDVGPSRTSFLRIRVADTHTCTHFPAVLQEKE